jgi:hypothetical protein
MLMGLIFYFLNEETVIFSDPIPGELDYAILFATASDFTFVITRLATLGVIRLTFGLGFIRVCEEQYVYSA